MSNTKSLLKEIFTQPTAPFKEFYVLSKIQEILEKNKIPCFEDAYGNLIAGVSNKKQIWKKPHLVYIAHTDHPGFHITKNISKNKYQALWFGGAPFKQMKGKSIKIYSHHNRKETTGKILALNYKEYKRSGMEMVVSTNSLVEVGSYGGFNFAGFNSSGDKINTRAADDLAGCVMALAALIDVKKRKLPVIAIFTRAEEVGFIGCIGMIEQKILNTKYSRVISLEASKTLPGALIGEGPVVRLGDASSIFNSKFSRFMQKTANELKKKDKNFKFQKKLMDGGSCEATAFDVYGFQTMGISVPLGNYHNQGARGPAPEIISVTDVENGRKLLVEIAKNHAKFDLASKEIHSRLKKQFVELKPLLKSNKI